MGIKKDGTVFRIELETSPSGFETRVSFALSSHGHMVRPRVEVSREELAKMVMESLSHLTMYDFFNEGWVPEGNERMPKLIASLLNQLAENPTLLNVAAGVSHCFLLWSLAMDELSKRTYAVQYSPNCLDPYLVRLVGPGSAVIDLKPQGETKDLLGYGKTMNEAVRNVLAQVKPPCATSA